MVNRVETYLVTYYAYFTAKLHQILKTLWQFENLLFVIISTGENISLIARTPFMNWLKYTTPNYHFSIFLVEIYLMGTYKPFSHRLMMECSDSVLECFT